MHTRRFRFLAALLLLSVVGCGYTTDSLIRRDIDTISVPVFENRTFRRGLEVQLTQAVIDELNMATHLRVVRSENADSKLVGTITDFKETVLTKTAADQIMSKEVTVYVQFDWIDLRTGRVLTRQRDVRTTKSYVDPAGENLEFASREAFRGMARRIVRLMEREW